MANTARPGLTRRALSVGALGVVPLPAAMVGTPLAQAEEPSSVADHVKSILPALRDQVRKAMADWQVPGLGLGVVVGDEVVLATGFGERVAGGGVPVDAETVFEIGSTTKAFCAATLAIMADRGKLTWNDRVIDHDPDFRLWDDWVTREFQIADLLAQRSGLRPYVLDFAAAAGFSPDALVTALRHVRPVSSFRTTFSYQNITHLVAGRIVARLAGVANWRDALDTLLLQPLGMASTTATVAALNAAGNHASGHVLRDGKPHPFDQLPAFDVVGAAGAMNSNVTDMLIWLRLQMGGGTLDGREIVSRTNLAENWLPRVAIGGIPEFPLTAVSYANGWLFVSSANGTYIWHNGGTGLFRTHVGFVPKYRIGIVVLTNEGTNELADSLATWFYDRVLGNPEVDHNARALDRAKHALAAAATAIRPPAPALPPGPHADYLGHYHSPVLGEATIAEAADGLELSLVAAGAAFLLVPWNGDSFTLLPRDRHLAELSSDSPQLVQFRRRPRGEIDTLLFIDQAETVLRRTG